MAASVTRCRQMGVTCARATWVAQRFCTGMDSLSLDASTQLESVSACLESLGSAVTSALTELSLSAPTTHTTAAHVYFPFTCLFIFIHLIFSLDSFAEKSLLV